MNKFKSILTKDIGWKLFSVIIAICMWFIVLNVENPVETKSFSSNIEIENENAIVDQNKTILNIEEVKSMKINIKISGKRLTLDKLSYGKGVTAYIDLSCLSEKFDAQEATIPVHVKIPSLAGESVIVENVSPSTITIKTDNLISKDMDITLVTEGTEVSGFETSQIYAEPSKITVYGPSAEVEKVTEVRGVVDVSTIMEDISVKCTPIAYDAEGNVVETVFLSSNSVDVNVDVKHVKKINVEASVSGVPAEGYVVEGVTVSPENIYVTGEPSILSKVNSIVIDAINVHGKSESFSTDIYIANYLPGGVYMKKGSSEKIQLNVEIVPKAEKEILISSENIKVSGLDETKYDIVIPDEKITVMVCGEKENIEKFDETKAVYSVDINGLSSGVHHVNILCEFPDDIELCKESPNIAIEIKEKTVENENIEETEN